MVVGCQTSGLGHLLCYMRARVQCRDPKTGQERVQFYCEDELLFLSTVLIIFLWFLTTTPPPPMKEKLPQLSGRTNENAGKSVLLLSFVWMFFTEDDGDWAENVPNVESFLLIFFFYF